MLSKYKKVSKKSLVLGIIIFLALVSVYLSSSLSRQVKAAINDTKVNIPIATLSSVVPSTATPVESPREAPLIKDIKFETPDGKVIKPNQGWYELGSKVKIVITLEGNCTEVDLFITPTGSATYKLQKLIDSVYPENNIAEYTWDVPQGLLGHFNIIAYNGDIGRKSDYYNVDNIPTQSN